MKTKISCCDEFRIVMERYHEDCYSWKGFNALYQYLEENYDDDYVVDPSEVCDKFTEYGSIEEACDNYENHSEIKKIMDECEEEDAKLSDYDYMEKIISAFDDIGVRVIQVEGSCSVILEE